MPNRSAYGHPQGTMVAGVWTLTPATVATIAALKAVDTTQIAPYSEQVVLNDTVQGPCTFYFHPTSALTGDDILVVEPTVGAGAWLRKPGAMVDLALPFTFATADAAVLLTMPTGSLMFASPGRGYWDIAVDMTGGSSSAIGLSGPSPHNTKGDLLGGGSGDVLATLTAALAPQIGTIGADNAAGIRLKAADTIKFDRITSAFTAGSGNAHVVGFLAKNAGA